MHKNVVLGLAVLGALLGGGWHVYLPVLNSTGSQPFRWSFVGVDFSGNTAYNTAVTQGMARWDYHSWSSACADEISSAATHTLYRHIPEIWGVQLFNDAHEMDTLFNGPCNDGRPLLFLNEPEQSDQANLAPGQAADMFYAMTRGSWPRARWHGPIYAGGALLEHEAWVDAFLASFASHYNGGSKRVPEIAGWHLHLYANTAGLDSTGGIAAMSDAKLAAAVANEDRSLTGFAAARQAEGNASSIVFDEMGFLVPWPPAGGATLDQYSERIAALMQRQDAMLRKHPEVQGWMWFMVYGDAYPASNLVHADGTLSAAGRMWRQLAAVGQ